MKYIKLFTETPTQEDIDKLATPLTVMSGTTIIYAPKNSNTIRIQGTNYNLPVVGPKVANVGDIVYLDGTTLKSVSLQNWNASLGTPIGVVAIPSTHDIYGTGECTIVALAEYSSVWSATASDTSLTNYANVPLFDGTVATANGKFLPIQTTAENVSEDGYTTVYEYSDNCMNNMSQWGDERRVVSPFNGDGTKNTSFFVEGCITGDINGVSNTATLIAAAGDEACAAKVAAAHEAGNLDWYLGAFGEVAYLSTKHATINASLTALGAPTLCSVVSTTWSSTEQNESQAWYTNPTPEWGTINAQPKTNSKAVRPMARITL